MSFLKLKDQNKNFILGIRNPSNGAKIGQHSAAVVSLSKGNSKHRHKFVI